MIKIIIEIKNRVVQKRENYKNYGKPKRLKKIMEVKEI